MKDASVVPIHGVATDEAARRPYLCSPYNQCAKSYRSDMYRA